MEDGFNFMTLNIQVWFWFKYRKGKKEKMDFTLEVVKDNAIIIDIRLIYTQPYKVCIDLQIHPHIHNT